PTVPPKQTQPARTALLDYLRGVGSGDTRVCAAMTPAYERAMFGREGGCRPGLAGERRRLRPKDLAALRTVSVPVAEPGPEPGTFTVGFEDLRWEGDPARPGGLLAARFTLRRSGKNWVLVP
ncbi:hypothetical protein ACSNOI_46110, partial [Actinomadura kijaniata]|uniref:hypothetical protein n=1 Tax=Actinomadura kijaniata TaxID=46161 RepID=UPI003F19E216